MGVMSSWADVRAEVAGLPEQVPDAWAFGATSEQADELLGLVLAGTKTGTASSLWDYEAEGEPLPTAGDPSILLDGRGEPRAVIRTTDVHVAPFCEVGAGHARAEGEGDRSLAHWCTRCRPADAFARGCLPSSRFRAPGPSRSRQNARNR